jgi:hypothetical protein
MDAGKNILIERQGSFGQCENKRGLYFLEDVESESCGFST